MSVEAQQWDEEDWPSYREALRFQDQELATRLQLRELQALSRESQFSNLCVTCGVLEGGKLTDSLNKEVSCEGTACGESLGCLGRDS